LVAQVKSQVNPTPLPLQVAALDPVGMAQATHEVPQEFGLLSSAQIPEQL
jgi:hypothetical protein